MRSDLGNLSWILLLRSPQEPLRICGEAAPKSSPAGRVSGSHASDPGRATIPSLGGVTCAAPPALVENYGPKRGGHGRNFCLTNSGLAPGQQLGIDKSTTKHPSIAGHATKHPVVFFWLLGSPRHIPKAPLIQSLRPIGSRTKWSFQWG